MRGKRGLLYLVGAIGLPGSSAQGALLSLRFAGGATEITLAPDQMATIEIVFTGDDWGTKVPHKVTGFDARFDVGALVAGVGGDYVQDGSTDLEVLTVIPWPFPCVIPECPQWWSTVLPAPPVVFNRSFFASAGDGQGVHGPDNVPGTQTVLGTLVIHKQSFAIRDTYVVFRAEDPLPGLYDGAVQWDHRFQGEGVDGPRQFEIGTGNPGDADPRFAYHGYETLQPLIIHQVPEPGAMLFFSLAGASLLRRRPARDKTAL